MTIDASVDVRTIPGLQALVHDVQRSGRARQIIEDGAAVAVIMPVRSRSRRSQTPSRAAIERTLSAAGGWKDVVDTAALKRTIKGARGSSRRGVAL